MKFYSVGEKKHVEVPEKDCSTKKTKNGKHMAQANMNGKKLTKFISKAEYERLNKE